MSRCRLHLPAPGAAPAAARRVLLHLSPPPLTCLLHTPTPTLPHPPAQSAGATSAKTFDLAVRMRNGQDYLFRGIPR